MILQALCSYYRRAASDSSREVVPPGYTMAGVSAELVLSPDGELVAANPLLETAGKKLLPRQLAVPLPPKRSGRKPEAAFLYETVAFLFGIYEDPAGARYRFEASRAKHEEILAGCEDEGAAALRHFFEKRRFGAAEWPGVDTSALKNPRAFVVFRLRGDEQFLHERPAIRAAWDAWNRRGEEDQQLIQCLVTGERGPLAVLHGNVSGFGADKPTLVGFNQDSFCSFGLYGQQGANAPVSRRAAFEYVTALNMLCGDPRHHFRLSRDQRVLFWAEKDIPQQESILAFLFGAPPDGDAKQTLDEDTNARIRRAFRTIRAGGQIDPELGDPHSVFYLLGVSANKTRLVIRFFQRSTFGDLLSNLADHYALLEIAGMRPPWPAPYLLLLEGVLDRDPDRIPPAQGSALLRSILDKAPYPSSLYQSILRRIRAEGAVTPLRAAVLKATVNRNAQKEVLKVSLDRNETDIAYRLGRLFALIERTQYFALGDVNATVADKYLNAALASPQQVFPSLLALNQKHLSKLAGGEQKDQKRAYFLRKEIGEIMDSFSLQHVGGKVCAFPDTMDTNGQGKFLVGYYHQTQSFFAGKPAAEE